MYELLNQRAWLFIAFLPTYTRVWTKYNVLAEQNGGN